MAASEVSGWIRHPFAEALMRFNLLPSLFVHPDREPPVDDDAFRALPALHRHRSAELLKEYGFDPVVELGDPALPLAVLPQEHFERLMLLLGAALNAPHIRRTIERNERAVLKEQIGTEGLAAARSEMAAALANLPLADDWEHERAASICSLWGAALLAVAFDAASPDVGGRGRLRLSPDADSLRVALAAANLTPERALAAARDMLQSLEPAWLSSFPAAIR
jgi:hypothetical protein